MPRSPALPRPKDLRGVWLAVLLLSLWLGSFLAVAWVPLTLADWPWALAVVLLRAFICTGVFITAHDAMHGIVAPGRPWLNDTLGTLATRAFAWFSFRTMRTAHHAHHATPAAHGDPDWHDGTHSHPVRWLFSFMGRYVTVGQVVTIAVAHNVMVRIVGMPEPNLWVFLWLPPGLAALQLFTFGTWLPHREPATGHTNPHRANSSGLPVWLSFLTCYHFGYHHTHHEYPWVPWWQMPAARRVLLRRGLASEAPNL